MWPARKKKTGTRERQTHDGCNKWERTSLQGGIRGRRKIKGGRKWFRYGEMETQSVRGSVKRQSDGKRWRRRKLWGSGVSDVQKGHSTAASSLVWPWWDYNMPAAMRSPSGLNSHTHTQLILHLSSLPIIQAWPSFGMLHIFNLCAKLMVNKNIQSGKLGKLLW